MVLHRPVEPAARFSHVRYPASWDLVVERREGRKTSHPRLQERLINGGLAQRLHIGPPGAKHTLGHANKNQVVRGIDPEPGVRRSEPEESGFANHRVGVQRVREERAIVTPPQARPGTHKKPLTRHKTGGKMV